MNWSLNSTRETDISIDVNIRGPGGYTSLMVAVMLGNVQREGEDESDYECTRPSLINGSEAASPPRSLTVKDLLRMKADPNLKNDLGESWLTFLMFLVHTYVDVYVLYCVKMCVCAHCLVL